MKKISLKALALTGGMCLALSQAYATNLPVSPITPPLTGFATPAAGGVVDLENWKMGSTTKGSVDLVEGVWKDPSTGFMDFFYQIQNNSPAAATGANTVGNTAATAMPAQTTVVLTGYYAPLTESVFDITSTTYSSSYFATSGIPFTKPTTGSVVVSANNSTPGEVIATFNTNFAPGQNSAILLIKTDAPSFDTGGRADFTWKQNPSLHGATSGTAYLSENIDAGVLEPAPEPGFYGLLSLGLAGLFLVVRRRYEKSKGTL